MAIFFFTGENAYMLNQELNKRKSTFLEKYGSDGLFEFSQQNWDLGQIKQALYAGGLFVSKKLVILYGVPKDGNESNALSAEKMESFFDDLQANIGLMTEDTLLVLVSQKPDKRTRAYKRCLEKAQLKEFAAYKEIQLKAFLKEKLAPLSLGDQELSHLIFKIGTDMYRLDHEAEKLKIWLTARNKSNIEIADIDYFCFWATEQDSFELFDQLFLNQKAAVKILERMHDDGKVWNEVMGLLMRGIKLYLILLDFDQRGISSAKEIIAQTKLHPFVINKNMKLLPILREQRAFIVSFFKGLVKLESDIKSGKKSELYFWLYIKTMILTLKLS